VVGYKGIEALRVVVTGVITALSATNSHNPYALAIIAGVSAFATHAVPSIIQKGSTMTTPTGPELMGIVKPVETAAEPAVAPVETDAVAVETAIKDPDTENVETAVTDAVPAAEAVVKAAPGVAQALREAADALRRAADNLL
jgi:hypothetical protein